MAHAGGAGKGKDDLGKYVQGAGNSTAEDGLSSLSVS